VGVLLDSLGEGDPALSHALRRARRAFEQPATDDARHRSLGQVAVKARERIQRLALRFADGDLDREGYDLGRRQAQADLEAAERALADLADRRPGVALPPLEEAPARLGGWRGALLGEDVAARRDVLGLLVEQLEVERLDYGMFARRMVWSPVGQALAVLPRARDRGGVIVWGDGQRVSVVFPAYNEAGNIARAVGDFRAVPAVDEVIVVDNNSRDATADLAREAGARVVAERRQGYGYALRRGLREATGDYVVLAEPDGTFVARDVVKLLAYADEFALVLGTRTTRELIWDQANMGWFLRVGNVAVAKLLQVLFDGPSLSDCGCTLRLIRREALEVIEPRLSVGGSHFLPEMVILALLHRLRIIEIPINYRRRVGDSKITGSRATTLGVGSRMIGLIVDYRLKSWARGLPGRS
jgi:Glycosyl transferase family 2